MMGGPDYAHWRGFFELQQDLYKLENIYNKRLASGKIEGTESILFVGCV
jgi:hypothetical protein